MERTGSGRFEGDTWDPASSVGATATGVAAGRALASKGPTPLLDDPFAEPLVRAVGIDVFVKLANGEIDLSDDPAFSQTMMAEGLLVYLPPEAQDRLFDNITALSAPGSRLATEQVPNMDAFSDEKSQERRERMRRLLNVDMSELVYHGERNHVIDYLTTHGWDGTASGTPELYAANGFTLPDDDTGAAMTNVQYISATLQQGA